MPHKFKLTFKDYESAWHENVRERIKRIDAEHVSKGQKPPDHGLYYSAQFDDIPFIEWEDMFGYLDWPNDFVEFTIGE